MDDKSLHVLEFHKIMQLLEQHVSSALGAEKVNSMAPTTDLETANRWLKETTEARDALRLGPSPLGGLSDIRASVRRAGLGGVLEPVELLEVGSTLAVARKVRRFLAENGEQYPLLNDMGIMVTVHKKIEDAIAQCIDDRGEVSDHASPELRRVRQEIRTMQGRVKERLENMIRSPQMQKYLQDPIVTLRNDRYVVPVKQEFRGQVHGIVHDQSSSGATLFIEPMAVVEVNNDLRRLVAHEREEIIRILRTLSAMIAEEVSLIEKTVETLGEFDFTFAKARLSDEMDAIEPRLNDQGVVDLYRARHPLLRGEVVPISIHLGKSFRVLLITGPNTGGKTVSLKTVGLLSLMAQSGLHIPAREGSELAVFDQVFADIGDEQSIEQSLSTFSSHMSNIVRIITAITPNSLVLLDELGAGTDPTEGAVLAVSILEFLLDNSVRVVATTHYSELKAFAYSRDEVENASVEFDVETLRPTYRLLIGIPGRSNAFEISRRLGLPDELIENAKGLLDKEQVRVEDLIASLEANQKQSEDDRRAARDAKAKMDAMRREMEKERELLARRSQEIIRKAHQEAAQIIGLARSETEEIIEQVRSLRAEMAEREVTQISQDVRRSLKELSSVVKEQVDEGRAPLPKKPVGKVRAGDTVHLTTYGIDAVVVSDPSGDEVTVQAGIMKLTVPLDQLTSAEKKKHTTASASAVGRLMAGKSETITTELDLRGMTLDEAVEAVDKYLDDAYLASLERVRIIHGKGTGVLRQGIREFLRRHHHVKSYAFAAYNEGGDGVTIAELKS
ncbi:MAG: endonuclease MutS2 [Bacillota bacterium]